MSSTYSPVLADFHSDSKEPECEQSPSARSSPIAAPSSESTGPTSPAMTTCEPLPLTASRQTELFPMSFVAAFPARTSPGRAPARGFMANVLDYGASLPELLAKLDRVSQSWKTQQRCFVEGLATFSGTWPASGTMQNGIAYRLAILALPTRGNAFGWWPTPRASDRDNCGGSGARSKARKHGTYIGRGMNPQVSEWLQGFPIGWSELPPSETVSCLKSRNSSAKP